MHNFTINYVFQSEKITLIRVIYKLWFQITFFMFNIKSTTSSFTPCIVENSCNTLSIFIAVMAAPCKVDSKTLRKAFPSVKPYPLSNGSAMTVPLLLSPLVEILTLLGLIKSSQCFSSVNDYCLLLPYSNSGLNYSVSITVFN